MLRTFPLKKEGPGAVCEAVSSTLHWNEQLRPTDTGSSYCLFQKKVNCFANTRYQLHVIDLAMGPNTVSIGTTPSCTYEDVMKSRTVKVCKYLIWVYVVVLGVNEKDDTLQQAALTEQEFRSIFQRTPPPCT